MFTGFNSDLEHNPVTVCCYGAFEPQYHTNISKFENIDIKFIYKCKIEFQKIHDFLRIPL